MYSAAYEATIRISSCAYEYKHGEVLDMQQQPELCMHIFHIYFKYIMQFTVKLILHKTHNISVNNINNLVNWSLIEL